jgi:hypothetical protein
VKSKIIKLQQRTTHFFAVKVKKKQHASLHVTKMELTSFVNFAAEKFEARFEKVCSYLKEFTHAAKSEEIKDR